MLVRITPPGRRARTFNVSGVQRSWDIAGGCATASIPLVLTADDAERILLAKVECFGASGLDWVGKVWRQPRYGAPLECAGQAIGLTGIRGREFYGYGGFLGELLEWNGADWGIFKRSIQGGIVEVLQTVGTTSQIGDSAGYIYFGDKELTGIDFACVNSATVSKFYISNLDVGRTSFGTPYVYESAGTLTGQHHDFPAGCYGFIVAIDIDTSYTPTDTTVYVKCYNMRLHTTSLSSITASTVIGHCLDQLPTHVLPAGAAYRRYVDVTTDVLDSIGFDDPATDLKAKCDRVVETCDKHFGFYPRRIGNLKVGVPVFKTIPSTPTVAIDVRQATSDSMRDRSASDLASEYLVKYPDQDGRVSYITTADPNTAHYLNRLGYELTGVLDTPWTTSPTTAGYAAIVAAGESERGADGSVTITRARLTNGREIPVTYLETGMLARVYGIGSGTRDMVIRHLEAVDSHQMAVTFGTPLDLQHLTARARRSA